MATDQHPGGARPPAPATDPAMATEWPAPFVSTGPPPGPEVYGTPPSRRVSWYIPLLGRLMMFCAALVAFGALTAGAFDAFEFEDSRAVTAQPIAVTGVPTIDVRNAAGNIRVVTGGAGRVEANAEIHTRGFSRGSARREAERARLAPRLSTSADGGTVVTFDLAQGDGWWLFGGRSVDLTVTVPPQSNLTLDMSAGEIDVRGVTGAFTIDASAGNTDLEDVNFTGVSRIESNAGNVTIDGELAANATVAITGNAGNINVTLPDRNATRLDAVVNVGGLTVNPWSVPVYRQGALATASGNLNPDPNSTLTIRGHAGSTRIVAPGSRSAPDHNWDEDRPALPTVPPVPTVPPLPSR